MSEKLKGEAREVYGAFIGDEAKREGRTLRRKAEAQEEFEQREKTAVYVRPRDGGRGARCSTGDRNNSDRPAPVEGSGLWDRLKGMLWRFHLTLYVNMSNNGRASGGGSVWLRTRTKGSWVGPRISWVGLRIT